MSQFGWQSLLLLGAEHPHSVPWPKGRPVGTGVVCPFLAGSSAPQELPWPVDGPCSDAPSVAWCSPVLAHQQSLARGATQTPSPPSCGAPSQTSVQPVCTLLLHSTLALLSYRPTVPDAGPSLSDADWSRWQVGLPVCGWTAQPFHHFVGGGE